jgi:hypothetical protein
LEGGKGAGKEQYRFLKNEWDEQELTSRKQKKWFLIRGQHMQRPGHQNCMGLNCWNAGQVHRQGQIAKDPVPRLGSLQCICSQNSGADKLEVMGSDVNVQ